MLFGTFLILTVSAASDALAAGTWSTTGSMTVARFGQTATLLTDGRVLVAGGSVTGCLFDCLGSASAELYNPATGTWSTTGSMNVGRMVHTATRLLDGRVLVVGGCGDFDADDGTCNVMSFASAELYNPATGTWSTTGSMNVGQAFPTATLLLDGRVLLVGADVNRTDAELYDPTTGTWSVTGSPSDCCSNTATLLLDGRVLLVPGPSAELYNPTTGRWSTTGSPINDPNDCCVDTATLLMDGRVLATGLRPSAELYDPTTGTWSPTGSTLGCCFGTATLRMDGTVLFTGGTPVLYDPTTGAWSPTGTASFGGTATLLLDGRVLVAGGGPNGTSAELFTSSPPGPLVAAVQPSSRSVQVGAPATAFATIINTGTSTATGCQIAPGTTLPASFAFQTTNPATNAVTGTINTPVDIPANAAQSFVVAFTPTAAIPPTDVPLNFFCANATAAPVVSGINTLLLSASTAAVPEIVAESATLNNDGIVNIPGTTGTGVFAVATVNLGAGGTVQVSADTGLASLPVSILLCQTDPATGQCVNPTASAAGICQFPTVPSPCVLATMDANATSSFGLFVTGDGTAPVPFAPAANRVFVRFLNIQVGTPGSTSVAVRTQ
jgi:hypothetical protein